MRSLALHGALRRQLTWLHRWSGLAVLLLLLVASLTGTWLVFRDELDRRINPHLRVVAIGEHYVPLTDVYAQVERQFPGTRVSTVILQKQPDDALIVYVRQPPGGPALPFDRIYADPYTGRILGTRSDTLTFSKESLDPLIFRMHYTLLLGQSGLWLMGGCAIIWLLTNLIGLALSWPQAWRRLVAWVPILSVRISAGSYKVNYDAHRAIGVWLLPIFTVLAFTSVYLNLPQLVRPAVNAFSPLAKSPARSSAVGVAALTPDQAIDIANATVSSGRPNSVIRDLKNRSYTVWLQRSDDPSPYGNNAVYIDAATGAVTATRVARTESAGDRFIDWQFPLHTGMAFGLPGRIVIALSGVNMVVLSVTGFYVWLRKWRTRRTARSRARAVVPGRAMGGRRESQVAPPVAARDRLLQPERLR